MSGRKVDEVIADVVFGSVPVGRGDRQEAGVHPNVLWTEVEPGDFVFVEEGDSLRRWQEGQHRLTWALAQGSAHTSSSCRAKSRHSATFWKGGDENGRSLSIITRASPSWSTTSKTGTEWFQGSSRASSVLRNSRTFSSDEGILTRLKVTISEGTCRLNGWSVVL